MENNLAIGGLVFLCDWKQCFPIEWTVARIWELPRVPSEPIRDARKRMKYRVDGADFH